MATVLSTSLNPSSEASAPSSRAALRKAAACFSSPGGFVFIFVISSFAKIGSVFLVQHFALKCLSNTIFYKSPDYPGSTLPVAAYPIQFVEIGQNNWPKPKKNWFIGRHLQVDIKTPTLIIN